MNDKFKNIFNFASDSFIIFNKHGVVEEVNPQACKMYAYTRDEFMKLTWCDLNHPQNSFPFSELVSEINKWGRFYGESQDIKKTGEIINVEISGSLLNFNNDKHYLIIVRNITQRKQDEFFIYNFFDFQMELIDKLPHLVWRTGVDGKSDYFNSSWLNFTGRTLNQENNNGWIENIHPLDRDYFQSTFNNAFNQRNSFEIEHRLHRYDGEYRWIVNSGKPYFDFNGNFAGYIGACHDVTQRKKSEQALKNQYKKFEQELQLAASVQYQMLPKELPTISNVSFSWKFEPSIYVAGDMFSFFEINENKIGFYILDVMGHGVQAALKAITLDSFFKPTTDKISQPAEKLKILNHYYNTTLAGYNKNEFFTIFYGVLNTDTLDLWYSRAGHNPPLLFTKNKTIKELRQGEPAGGLLDEPDYQSYHIKISPGDKLFLYTDSIIEARSPKNNFYSKDRLTDIIIANQNMKVEETIHAIFTDVKNHIKSETVTDDLTLLGIEIDQ